MPSTIFTDSPDALADIHQPGVNAVVYVPPQRDQWETELATAVEHGAFVVERTTLTVPCADALIHQLEQRLPERGLEWSARLALIDDLAGLAERLAAIAPCRALTLRLFTEPPTRHCGFHVDMVSPGGPPVGLLKVYNGAGTVYIEASDVASVRGFYDYLLRRERWVRAHSQAVKAGRHADSEVADVELATLDRTLPFLRPGTELRDVPAGSQVAFKLLDAGEHGSAHARDRAWIHCSPMEGSPRLVVNFTPLDGPRALPR